jgi:hypothetical protein
MARKWFDSAVLALAGNICTSRPPINHSLLFSYSHVEDCLSNAHLINRRTSRTGQLGSAGALPSVLGSTSFRLVLGNLPRRRESSWVYDPTARARRRAPSIRKNSRGSIQALRNG